jgi:hypothetical protein
MVRPMSAEDLLAGASATYTIEIPASVLRPESQPAGIGGTVVLRPLTVRDVQRVTQAAKEQRVLASILMVQQALVEPKLSVDQVNSLSAGLVEFLLGKVNATSGLRLDGDDLERAVKAPLAKACFLLAREFGWTPAQCSELTVGQILVYLEMLARGDTAGGTGT